MRVCRKGAILMLAAVVLWTAVPALACLLPAPARLCCQTMQGCEASLMNASDACCQMHAPDSTPPAGRTSLLGQPRSLAQLSGDLISLAVPTVSGMRTQKTGQPPLSFPPGASSVLRI